MSQITPSPIEAIRIAEPRGYPYVQDGMVVVGTLVATDNADRVFAIPRRGIDSYQLAMLTDAAETVWLHGTGVVSPLVWRPVLGDLLCCDVLAPPPRTRDERRMAQAEAVWT